MKKSIGTILMFLLFLNIGSTNYASSDLRESSSPYGVLSFIGWNHDWNFNYTSPAMVEQTVRLMREAGVGFVRMDFLWDDIEPSPNRFVFDKYDWIVDLLTRNEIKILGLLSYNAAWAAEYWNSPPDPELFIRYATAVVHRYRERVRYWEIWNEPDDPNFWRHQDGLKTYAGLLKKVTPALKKVDPTCRVLMGGVSRSPTVSLRNLYRYAGKDAFDIVSFHPFTDPKRSNAMAALRGLYRGIRNVMAEYGDLNKEIWITEIGCPGVHPALEKKGWWLGPAPTEEEQALWLERIYTQMLRWKGIEKIFWAFFRDTPNYFRNAVDHFGLVRLDFSKKPAFESYKKLIK